MELRSRGKADLVAYSPLFTVGLLTFAAEKLAPGIGECWPVLSGLWIAGGLGIALAVHARRQAPSWHLERQTGREYFSRPIHSCLGLAVEYWGSFYIALGIVWFLFACSGKNR